MPRRRATVHFGAPPPPQWAVEVLVAQRGGPAPADAVGPPRSAREHPHHLASPRPPSLDSQRSSSFSDSSIERELAEADPLAATPRSPDRGPHPPRAGLLLLTRRQRLAGLARAAAGAAYLAAASVLFLVSLPLALEPGREAWSWVVLFSSFVLARPFAARILWAARWAVRRAWAQGDVYAYYLRTVSHRLTDLLSVAVVLGIWEGLFCCGRVEHVGAAFHAAASKVILAAVVFLGSLTLLKFIMARVFVELHQKRYFDRICSSYRQEHLLRQVADGCVALLDGGEPGGGGPPGPPGARRTPSAPLPVSSGHSIVAIGGSILQLAEDVASSTAAVFKPEDDGPRPGKGSAWVDRLDAGAFSLSLVHLMAKRIRCGAQINLPEAFFHRGSGPKRQRVPGWSGGAALDSARAAKRFGGLLFERLQECAERGGALPGSAPAALDEGDLEAVVGAGVAGEVFEMLVANSGSPAGTAAAGLTKKTLRAALEAQFNERRDLARALSDKRKIVRSLETIVFALLVIVDVFVVLLIYEVNVGQWWVTLSTSVVAFSFFYASYFSDLLKSIVLHFVWKPFEVGDVVAIDEHSHMRVESVDLHATDFRLSVGRHVSIPNSQLWSKSITNLSRSEGLWDCFTLRVDVGLGPKELEAVQRDVERFVRADAAEFSAASVLATGLADPLKVEVAVWFQLASNGADIGRTNAARTRALFCVQQSLLRQGLRHTAPAGRLAAGPAGAVALAHPTRTLKQE